MGVMGLSVLAYVPISPADSPLHVAWGRRNIHSTLPRFHPPEDLVLLILTQRDGLSSSCATFGGILHQLITKGCSLSFSCIGILHCFPHAGSRRNHCCHSGFSGAGASHVRGCVPVCSIPILVVGVCCRLWSAFMFSPVNAGSLASFPFVNCVMLPLFHCEDWGCCLPWFWVAAELFWPHEG